MLSLNVVIMPISLYDKYENQKNYPDQLNLSDFEDKNLANLDDDDPSKRKHSRAMEKKGFQ